MDADGMPQLTSLSPMAPEPPTAPKANSMGKAGSQP